MRKNVLMFLLCFAGSCFAQRTAAQGKIDSEFPAGHSECSFFGSQREIYSRLALQAMGRQVPESSVSKITRKVAGSIGSRVHNDAKASFQTCAPTRYYRLFYLQYSSGKWCSSGE